MGKYDIGAVLTDDCALTYADLADELIKEYPSSDDVSLYRSKLKNSDKSGIIDKLKRLLHFDVEKMARRSKQEKFAMLKLLKVLFAIEKYGDPKSKRTNSKNIRTTIIDVLAKPRMSNIETHYSDESEYGDIFESLLVKIQEEVGDAKKRQDSIDSIDDFWQRVLEKHFDYVNSNTALRYPEWAIKELERINRFLKNKVLAKMSSISPSSISKPEGVMKSFYNLLLLHEKLCYDYDRIKINYSTALDGNPTEAYVKLFIENENENIDFETISLVHRSFNCENKDEIVLRIRNLISYFEDIPQEDYSHYRYAFEKLDLVASWLKKEKTGFDFSKGYPLSILVTIIQEIVCIKKNPSKYTLRNDFVGYKRDKVTLYSALKNEDSADSILIQTWITRLENRYNINLGAYELIKEKRQAEIYIFEIKKILYEYRNLNDLKFANDLIAHFVALSTISQGYAYQIEQHFTDVLRSCLANNGIQLSEVYTKTANIFNLFRQFVCCKDMDTSIKDCAAQIAKMISNIKKYVLPPESNIVIERMVIKYDETNSKEFDIGFAFSRSESRLIYLQFVMIEPDSYSDRYRKLGLGEFFITKKEDLLKFEGNSLLN